MLCAKKQSACSRHSFSLPSPLDTQKMALLGNNKQVDRALGSGDVQEGARFMAGLVVAPGQDEMSLRKELELEMARIADLNMTQSTANHMLAAKRTRRLYESLIIAACRNLGEQPVTIMDMVDDPLGSVDLIANKHLTAQARELGMADKELDSVIERVNVAVKMMPDALRMQLLRDTVSAGLKDLGMDNMGVDVKNPKTFSKVLPTLLGMYTHGIIMHYKDNPEDLSSMLEGASITIKRLHDFAKRRIIDGHAEKTSMRLLGWSKKQNILPSLSTTLVAVLALSQPAEAFVISLATLGWGLASFGSFATVYTMGQPVIEFGHNAYKYLLPPGGPPPITNLNQNCVTVPWENPGNYTIPLFTIYGNGTETFSQKPLQESDFVGKGPPNSVFLVTSNAGETPRFSFISTNIGTYLTQGGRDWSKSTVFNPNNVDNNKEFTERGAATFKIMLENMRNDTHVPSSVSPIDGPNSQDAKGRWSKHEGTNTYINVKDQGPSTTGGEDNIKSFMPQFWQTMVTSLFTDNRPLNDKGRWTIPEGSTEPPPKPPHVNRRTALMAKVFKIPYLPFSGEYIIPFSILFKEENDGQSCEDALFNKDITDKDFVKSCTPFINNFVTHVSKALLAQKLAEKGIPSSDVDAHVFENGWSDDITKKIFANDIVEENERVFTEQVEAINNAKGDVETQEGKISGERQTGNKNAIATAESKLVELKEHVAKLKADLQRTISGHQPEGATEFDMVAQISALVDGLVDSNYFNDIGYGKNSLSGNSQTDTWADYLKKLANANPGKPFDLYNTKEFVYNTTYEIPPNPDVNRMPHYNVLATTSALVASGVILSLLTHLCARKGGASKIAKKRAQKLTLVDAIRTPFNPHERFLPEYRLGRFGRGVYAMGSAAKSLAVAGVINMVSMKLSLSTLSYLLSGHADRILGLVPENDPMLAATVVFLGQLGINVLDLTPLDRRKWMKKMREFFVIFPSGYSVDYYHPITPCNFAYGNNFLFDTDEGDISNYMFWDCFDDAGYWKELRKLRGDILKISFMHLDDDSNANPCEHALYNLFVDRSELVVEAAQQGNSSDAPKVLCLGMLDLLTHMRNAGYESQKGVQPDSGGIMSRLLPWRCMTTPENPGGLVEELADALLQTTRNFPSTCSIYSRCIIFILENTTYKDNDSFSREVKSLIVTHRVVRSALGKNPITSLETNDEFADHILPLLCPMQLDPNLNKPKKPGEPEKPEKEYVFTKMGNLFPALGVNSSSWKSHGAWNSEVQEWILYHKAVVDECFVIAKESVVDKENPERRLTNIMRDCEKLRVFLKTLSMLSSLTDSFSTTVKALGTPNTPDTPVFSDLQRQVFEGTRAVKNIGQRDSIYWGPIYAAVAAKLTYLSRLNFATVTVLEGQDATRDQAIRRTVENTARSLTDLTEVRKLAKAWFFQWGAEPVGSRHFDLRLLFSLLVICAKFESSEFSFMKSSMGILTGDHFMKILQSHFPVRGRENGGGDRDRVDDDTFLQLLSNKIQLSEAITAVDNCLRNNL